MKGNVIISKEYYLRLQINSERLHRLGEYGVYNWNWYDESLNPDNSPGIEVFEKEEKIRIEALGDYTLSEVRNNKMKI